MQLKSHVVNIVFYGTVQGYLAGKALTLRIKREIPAYAGMTKEGGDINNTRDVFSQILWRLPLDFQRFALEQGLSSLFKATANLRSSSPPEASPRRNENSLAT